MAGRLRAALSLKRTGRDISLDRRERSRSTAGTCMFRALQILALALPLHACDLPTTRDPARSIRFGTDRPEYRAGEEVTASLENRSGAAIAHNLCFTTIEHRSDGEWRNVASFGAGRCQLIWVSLPAGAVATSRAAVPTNLPAGPYRLRTPVELQADREEVITAEFAVLQPD